MLYYLVLLPFVSITDLRFSSLLPMHGVYCSQLHTVLYTSLGIVRQEHTRAIVRKG